jgi:hypothetical protein
MSDPVPARTAWVQPVLLAIATAAALGLGFLYLTRPNAGELGAIRVVVTDDNGKSGNAIRVVVAEAPLVQKEAVAPGTTYSGIVYYPAPYLTRPNLKLICGQRLYDVVAETELGFTWAAHLRPDDLREGALLKDVTGLEKLLGDPQTIAAVTGKLKPDLIFEDFTWEAKGLRALPSSLPPKVFEQKGSFYTVVGQEGVVFFPIPFDTPPSVQFFGHNQTTIVTECTAKNFKWRNVAKQETIFNSGDVSWTANGVRSGIEGK